MLEMEPCDPVMELLELTRDEKKVLLDNYLQAVSRFILFPTFQCLPIANRANRQLQSWTLSREMIFTPCSPRKGP
jgi:hypothetical protein